MEGQCVQAQRDRRGWTGGQGSCASPSPWPCCEWPCQRCLPAFQGNSNNIATVDISAGFVGLNTYMEVPAVFLTAFATYAGPVLWASHLVNFLSSDTHR